HLLMFPVQEATARQYDRHHSEVSVLPTELEHGFEVHAIEAENYRGNGENGAPPRELSYNIVLPNGDQRQVDLHGRHQHLPHTFRVLDLPHTVVLDVPQISMQRPGQQVVMESHQLVADVDNRSDGVTQAHQLPFESIGLFQPDPPQIFLEQAGFQCLKALAEFAESQSIIIDNLV